MKDKSSVTNPGRFPIAISDKLNMNISWSGAESIETTIQEQGRMLIISVKQHVLPSG